jgi:hypothetical protein
VLAVYTIILIRRPEGVSGVESDRGRGTYFPMKDSVKLTLSWTFCIAGSTMPRRQSCGVSAPKRQVEEAADL